MYTYNIRLNDIPEKEEFIHMMQKYHMSADIIKNRFMIDAASMLGIIYMDLRDGATLSCSSKNPEFEQAIAKFAY
ncbi:MAG: HPr family phosphocarrier protein [Lachnospiraceae bacterium]|nr:HPr family phosphocarrier protein [Lachnospiraceae bacterium]